MKLIPATILAPLVLLPAVVLSIVSAFAADDAAIKAEIEAVRKAGLAQWKDRLPDNFETYVRDTGTRNYYQRQFNVALTNGNAAALAVVFKEFPEFARPQFLNGYVVQIKSALHFAVERGYREVVELLLAQKVGADAPRPTTASVSFGIPPFAGSSMRPQFERRDTPLHLAVRAGNTDLVKVLLDAGASLEAMDTRGETPLMQTVKQLTGTGFTPSPIALGSDAHERLDRMLTLLLERGAVVVPTNRYYTSEHPLSLAARFRNDALFDRLLTNSTHRAATNEAGHSLVHFAVSHGRTNALRTLVGKGAPLTLINGAGFTPLQLLAWMPPVRELPPASPVSSSTPYYQAQTYAAFVRQQSADLLLAGGVVADAPSLAGLDRTNALIQLQPKLAATDAQGRGALHYALQGGSSDTVKLLLQARAPTEVRTTAGDTPLLFALAKRRFPDVTNLVAAGASARATNNTGQSALHLTVTGGGDTNLLALLVAAGADVNARDAAGKTPLEQAALNLRFDLVQWLEARGATLAAPTKRLITTPLHQAVAQGNLLAVSNQLAFRADVNARNEQGHTPLALAVGAGRVDLVLFLLTNGANVNLPDTNGVTPLRSRFLAANDPVPDPVPKPGFSKRPPAPAVAKTTTIRTDSLPPELRPSALPVRPAMNNNLLLLLLENGADPRIPDAKGNTILHALHPALTPPNDFTRTATYPPLAEAIARVRLLANYGLAPDTRASDGLTPLHAVAAQGNLVYAFALLEAGAGVNTPDHQGRTALHHVLLPPPSRWRMQDAIGAHRDRPHLLALLLDNGADLRRTDTNGATALHLLPGLDDTFRELVLPALKTNRHFAAALRVKNKAGQTPVLLAFEQLRMRPVAPAVKLLTTFLGSGGELPPATDLGSTTLLHELAGVGVIGHPFFGASQPDAENTATIARLASNVVAKATKIDVRNAKGETPLHVATRTHNAAFAAALLARGASPNAQDAQGDTPLHLALRSVASNTTTHPVIPLLVSNRCSLVLRNVAGETPLRLELTRQFANHGPLFLPPGATQSFFAAARAGDLASVEAYLTLEPTLATLADPVNQTTLLRSAALAGQKEIAERLRKAGATDPVSAAVLGWTNSLAVLVHENAAIGETNLGFGMPLLHLAASRGQTAVVQLLLTKSVPPGLEDAFGRTALYHATTNGNSGLVTWLTAHGMRLSLFDAIALADSKGLEAVLATGPARANETNRMAISALLMATDLGNLDIVQRLLAHGADPNQSYVSSPRFYPSRFIRGTVPLHLAAWSNRTDLAEALVGAKASLSVVNERGYSALHFAAARGHMEMAAWLLARGADANVQPVITNSSQTFPPMNPYMVNSGWTPLHVAVRFARPGTIETLVKHGAKLDLADAQGRTPADLVPIAASVTAMPNPWPPSPYPMFGPGMSFDDVRVNPARAAEVAEILRRLGAVIPSVRGATFINRSPPSGFPVPPPSIPPAPKP